MDLLEDRVELIAQSLYKLISQRINRISIDENDIHDIHDIQYIHTYIQTYITYMHTYMHTYIHTCQGLRVRESDKERSKFLEIVALKDKSILFLMG